VTGGCGRTRVVHTHDTTTRQDLAESPAVLHSLRRVALLAPMDIEIRPLIDELTLVADADQAETWRGTTPDGIEVVAVLTTIGMGPAAAAARRALREGVDLAMVVGIAGAVDPLMQIGDVLTPAIVEDRARGTVFRPPVGAPQTHGILSCGDDLITDADRLTALATRGVVALDMETAAIAAMCDEAGVAWSVHRAISDHAGGGLIDDSLLEMAGATGTADPAEYARLRDDPTQRARLEQLSRDATRAVHAAARNAIDTLAHLAR